MYIETPRMIIRDFAGEQTAEPVWEIMSDKPARAVKDISAYLHG